MRQQQGHKAAGALKAALDISPASQGILTQDIRKSDDEEEYALANPFREPETLKTGRASFAEMAFELGVQNLASY